MSWTLANKPVTLKVTKKLAMEFAAMEPAPQDRPLSERRLAVYQRLIREHQFRPVTWAKALCEETNGVYRVNGKHTSTLLAGLDPLPDFWVTVEEYVCSTLEDVAKLYATFDSQMQSRSARDIYLSFAGTVLELRDVPPKVVVLAVNAMSFRVVDTSAKESTAPDRAETLLEHPAFVLWLNAILGGAESKTRHLRRAPVSAAMFATWQKSVRAATEFWTAVRDETGATPDIPDRKLARYLLTSGVITRVYSDRQSKAVRKSGPREMYVKCVHGWNAWRVKESTNLNYYEDKPVPSIK